MVGWPQIWSHVYNCDIHQVASQRQSKKLAKHTVCVDVMFAYRICDDLFIWGDIHFIVF